MSNRLAPTASMVQSQFLPSVPTPAGILPLILQSKSLKIKQMLKWCKFVIWQIFSNRYSWKIKYFCLRTSWNSLKNRHAPFKRASSPRKRNQACYSSALNSLALFAVINTVIFHAFIVMHRSLLTGLGKNEQPTDTHKTCFLHSTALITCENWNHFCNMIILSKELIATLTMGFWYIKWNN